jgi:hypothetical protein
VLVAVAAVTYVVASKQQPIEKPPVGNPFEAPSDLASLIDSMPPPSGAETEPDDYVTEDIVDRFYTVSDTPEKAVAFFTAELPKEGWIVEQNVTSAGDPKTGNERTSAIFSKNEYRITVSASPNNKNPERGATLLQVTVGRR